MLSIGYLFILLATVHPSLSQAQDLGARPQRLCFLSLNQESERVELERKLGSGTGVEVREYFEYGDRAHEAFLRLLESGEECDGLVLSGHHRLGGFEGARAVGRLAIENLERWSCHPKYADWFRKIKNVWLQGCATSNRAENDQSELPNRYAHIFPNATVFAWSGSAPSRKAPSTIPFQVENFGILSANKDSSFSDKLAKLLNGAEAEAALASWQAMHREKQGELRGIFNRTARAFAPLKDRSDSPDAACVLENDSFADIRIRYIQSALLAPSPRLVTQLQREWKLSSPHPKYHQQLASLLRSISTNRLGSASQQKVWTQVQLYRLRLAAGGSADLKLEKQFSATIHRELARYQRSFDEVERKHHYGRLATAGIEPLPDGRVLLSSPELSQLKNLDASLAILRTLIEHQGSSHYGLVQAMSKNPNLNLEARRVLDSILRVSSFRIGLK